MNTAILSGRICTVPTLSLIELDGRQVCACKYVIAVCNSLTDYPQDNSSDSYKDGNVDFFECVAFSAAAKMINQNFAKGSKIICRGKMRNHRFEDANMAKHFTNIFLVEGVEYGDTEAVLSKFMGKKKPLEISIASDLRELDDLFARICQAGFLCVDESDYYNIAIANM
jgi:hypothetical protein